LVLIAAGYSRAQIDQSGRWENGIRNSWSLPVAREEELELLKSRRIADFGN
jgi:hypothetical protein